MLDWEDLRVYDTFLFNGEWEMLEIRLHELSPVVHTFLVIEFDTTFRGEVKGYAFETVVLQGPNRHR